MSKNGVLSKIKARVKKHIPHFGIQAKLTLIFMFLIVTIGGLSLGFVSFFLEDYVVQAVQRDLLSKTEKLAGYYLNFVGYDYTMDAMFEMVADSNYSIVVLDENGEYVDSRDAGALKRVFSNIKDQAPDALAPFVSEDGTKLIEIENRTMIMCTQCMSVNGYAVGYLVLLAPLSNYSFASTPLGLYFFAILVASVLGILIATLMAKTITANIKKLKVRANLLANRRFDIDVPINATDEIGELACSIDEMAKSIQEYDMNQKVFLQNASHELRTPLMSVRGYVEGIKDGVFEDTNENLDVILAQVSRLEKLINDVMYLSKIETAYGMLRFGKVNIQEITDEAFDRVMGIAVAGNIKLRKVNFHNETIFADGENLTVAITNILSNCLRFARSEVIVRLGVSSQNIFIVVSDDGPGIDPEELPHVFERFYKGKKGKHGLGLAIAKAVIEGHKGKIYAYNKPFGIDGEDMGKTGAVFVIALPRTEDGPETDYKKNKS